MQQLNVTEITGTGPTVVMLHGVFMDHHLWDEVAAGLPGRHLLPVDMPGHGASAGMDAGSTLADHIAAVQGTLDARGITGAVLVGHSWGGMVGVRLAHRRPDLVAGLVLTNTPLLRPTGRTRLGFLAQRAMLALGFPIGAYASAAARALHAPGYLAAHPETRTAMRQRLRALGRARTRRTVRSVILDPADAIDLATTLPVPHRILGGEHDYVLANGVADRLRMAGERVIVTAGGHTGPAEAPAPIAAAIDEMACAVSTAAETV